MFEKVYQLIARIVTPRPPLELCRAQGFRNEALKGMRREDLHWGRLR